ncbi:MAG TPA: Type 1 glutamine amidotransferase-like domain-containing protein [Actinomycetota bacterium]|nr:Type 1 glutamine amidotransferase-like domain-containing protein [Actinomycetota bacterium]
MSTWAFLGAGEFEPWHDEIDERLLDGRPGPVLVSPAAAAHEGDAVFDTWAAKGVAHYERLGVEVRVLPLRHRADAADDAVVAALDDAAMIFFSGGNPWRLAEMVRDTPFWARLRDRMDEGLAYAGCSAGVACLSPTTFDSDTEDMDAIFKPGLGTVPGVVFAPHWDTVDSWVPGATAYIERSVPTDQVLVGLDERTAMVGDGAEWQVDGLAGVHLRRDGDWEHLVAGSTFALEIA